MCSGVWKRATGKKPAFAWLPRVNFFKLACPFRRKARKEREPVARETMEGAHRGRRRAGALRDTRVSAVPCGDSHRRGMCEWNGSREGRRGAQTKFDFSRCADA